MTFSPAAVDLTAYGDELPVVAVTATIRNAAPVFPQFSGPAGVFQPSPPTHTDGATSTATFYFDDDIAPGVHEGNIELRLCADLPCSNQYDGSPFLLPFRVEVLAATTRQRIEAALPEGRWFDRAQALALGLPAPIRKLISAA